MAESNSIKEKIIHRYSESLKRQIVSEIESGTVSVREASEHYGVKHRRTITGWCRQYGSRVAPTKIVRVMMKDEQERIKELERALVDEQLKNRVYAAQLESYAEEVPDLKKRLNTEQLKKFEHNERKIRGMA